jgi:hypothetical protein
LCLLSRAGLDDVAACITAVSDLYGSVAGQAVRSCFDTDENIDIPSDLAFGHLCAFAITSSLPRHILAYASIDLSISANICLIADTHSYYNFYFTIYLFAFVLRPLTSFGHFC